MMRVEVKTIHTVDAHRCICSTTTTVSLERQTQHFILTLSLSADL